MCEYGSSNQILSTTSSGDRVSEGRREREKIDCVVLHAEVCEVRVLEKLGDGKMDRSEKV